MDNTPAGRSQLAKSLAFLDADLETYQKAVSKCQLEVNQAKTDTIKISSAKITRKGDRRFERRPTFEETA